jgi:hypothetical protein
MKLQINVSPEFAKQLDVELAKTHTTVLPNEKPPKLANLIPTALIHYADKIGATVTPEVRAEANDVLTRKPGPQKKKPLVSHNLFDPRPGVWIGEAAIETGFAIVRCGDQELSLAHCTDTSEAAARAVEERWGAIPEAKSESNDPNAPTTPGMRFIPPGASLLSKEPPKHAPLTLATVGTWISEESILTGATVVLGSGRNVPLQDGQAVPEDAFVVPGARVDPSPVESWWDENMLKAHAIAEKERGHQSVLASIAAAQIEAYELGWTCKRETRKGKVGVLFIPPKVRLTYEIGPGQMVAV